jgi:hypothetical protein
MKRKYSQQQQQIKKQQSLKQQQVSLTQVSPNIMVDMTILSRTNFRIKKKCPNLDLQLTIQDANNWLLELYKDKIPISIIKMNVIVNTITISSNTFGIENQNKKYNSILRSVLILLALSMQYQSKPIEYIYSTAVNWKTVKTLNQRNFVPTQIVTTIPPYFQTINQQIFKIFQDTQKLKKVMSGDEHDDNKPWVYVQMELDLLPRERDNIRQSAQTALSNAISKMQC